LIIWIVKCSNNLKAQSLRHQSLIVLKTSITLDTMQIVDESLLLFLNNQKIYSGFYFNDSSKILTFDSIFFNKKVDIYYRVFLININSDYTHKSLSMIEPTFVNIPKYFYNNMTNQNGNNSIFNSSGIDINGNIARGLGFGNNQDVVLNSNLNLQIGGNLGKGVSIIAAISDENNPIQPEGNTQQIQDFDKVFITLKKDSSNLTVGDVLMKSNGDNYFMKYYKKSRGLQFDLNTGNGLKNNFHIDAAISRGRFVRNQMQGIEGNQGPYRLNGSNNELNIIVISATEVVYLDGEKLNRGQQNDYVIDYNAGEITFMPKRLITQFNRIVIEFQYSDRNFNRSVFQVGNTIKSKKWTTSINYFSEQDNKLQPTDTSNRDIIQSVLEQSGDNPTLFQNVKQLKEFPKDRLVYVKKDTIVNFITYSIFRQINAPGKDTFFYTVSFSFIGQGKGNYILQASSANGRVYAWVPPNLGVPSGSYEPYIQLVAPNRMQMLSLSSILKLNSKSNLKIEGAYTNLNENTYSVIDKKNDDGIGLFFDFNQNDIKLKNLQFSNQLKLEYTSNNFKSIERYRSVEFDRTWNKQLTNLNITKPKIFELISNAAGSIRYKKFTTLNVELNNYIRGNSFNGKRTIGDFKYENAKFGTNTLAEYINTKDNQDTINRRSNYFKLNGGIFYNLKNIKIGIDAITEKSEFNADTSSFLMPQSFFYNQYSAYLQSLGSTKWNYKIEGSLRADKLPSGAKFKNISQAANFKSTLELNTLKNNRLVLTVNYREILNTNSATEQIILSRVEYNASFIKRVINISTYYQISNGKEQRKQYSYTQVLPGNGIYDWIDYNNNAIQEINEFEIAVFRDKAMFVKLYLPTNEFLKSNSNEFNQTIRLNAPQKWQNGNGLKKTLSRFNTITSYKADRRMTDNNFFSIVNPFLLNIADSSLIIVNSLIKQTTFFNRNSAQFGLEHNIQTNRGKQFLNSGFESKKINRQSLTARYAISKQINLISIGEMQSKDNNNQFFENRNYSYNTQSIFPEIFFQTIKGFRVGLFFKYLEAKNNDNTINNLYMQELGAEFRYFVVNKGNIDAKITSHNINFKGNANSPLAYDLLNGLSKGKNLTWNITFGAKTGGNIQLNISYEGRKMEVFKNIHIGRAEARYIF